MVFPQGPLIAITRTQNLSNITNSCRCALKCLAWYLLQRRDILNEEWENENESGRRCGLETLRLEKKRNRMPCARDKQRQIRYPRSRDEKERSRTLRPHLEMHRGYRCFLQLRREIVRARRRESKIDTQKNVVVPVKRRS